MKIPFYVQLAPEFYYGDSLRRVKVVNVTSKKPTAFVRGATHAVKVTLNIADSVFTNSIPSVEISVPEAALTSIQAEVEAA